MAIRTVIIEDERRALDLMIDYVNRTPSLELAASFQNGIEGLDYVNRNPVDLLLLDIHLREISGIDIANNLVNAPLIIITTANPSYAVEGFELDVLDYLVKPIVLPRFLKAIARAVKKIDLLEQEDREQKQSSRNAQVESGSFAQNSLFIKVDNRRIKLALDDIRYVEACGDYVSVHTIDGKSVLSLQTMAQVLEKLPNDMFARIHRSTIVNLNHVDVVEKDHLLIGDIDLTIGKSYRADFISLIDS